MIAKITPRPASSQTWRRGSVLMTCVIDSPGSNHVVSQGEAADASSDVMPHPRLSEATHGETGSIQPSPSGRNSYRASLAPASYLSGSVAVVPASVVPTETADPNSNRDVR